MNRSYVTKMQVSSGQSNPVRVYVGPGPGSPRANAVAVRVLVAWADFFRIPLQCFVAEPARPVRENYGELLSSGMYVAFAEGDTPAFLAEWHMASGLNIPAFGYVDQEPLSPLQPQPRMVHGLPNFSAALAADLVHYSNRGFSRVGHHASLRTLIAADPVLLCLVLAGLDGRDFRRVCSRLNFKGNGGRLIMCREVMRDPSERHCETVTQCLESEIPTIFGSAVDTAGRPFFPFQASAYVLEIPGPRTTGATSSEVSAPLPISSPRVSDDLEIPGEFGQWVKFGKAVNRFRHRNPIGAALLVFLVLSGVGVLSLQERIKALIGEKVDKGIAERVAAGLYLGAWPRSIDEELTWTLKKGDQWDKVTRSPAQLPVDEGSVWFADPDGKVFADYFTDFEIVLDHDQRYVAWIARGAPKSDYYAIEYLFPSTVDKNTGVGSGIIQGCLYHADKRGRCAPFPGFPFAPLRDGDRLHVFMVVRGNLATMSVTLERHPTIFGAPASDLSNQDQVLRFSVDDSLDSGLFGVSSEPKQSVARKVGTDPGHPGPGFRLVDFSLYAYAKDTMPTQSVEKHEAKAEAPPK